MSAVDALIADVKEALAKLEAALGFGPVVGEDSPPIEPVEPPAEPVDPAEPIDPVDPAPCEDVTQEPAEPAQPDRENVT